MFYSSAGGRRKSQRSKINIKWEYGFAHTGVFAAVVFGVFIFERSLQVQFAPGMRALVFE